MIITTLLILFLSVLCLIEMTNAVKLMKENKSYKQTNTLQHDVILKLSQRIEKLNNKISQLEGMIIVQSKSNHLYPRTKSGSRKFVKFQL